MPYVIEIADLAYDELQAIRVFYRRKILDAIDLQLSQEPTVETRNRKALIGLQAHFEHAVPLWELRVGEFRVYYDVDEGGQKVIIRAVRQKPPHSTTEQSV